MAIESSEVGTPSCAPPPQPAVRRPPSTVRRRRPLPLLTHDDTAPPSTASATQRSMQFMSVSWMDWTSTAEICASCCWSNHLNRCSSWCD